jgi:SAM-dependent methyltransferase
MPLSEADLKYFARGETENPRFFERLGGEPRFERKRVLDIGCGHGSLCVYVASRAAALVIGVDIDSRRIEFFRENLKANYPHLIDNCKCHCCSSSDLKESGFDMILSKDTLEHIIEPERVLSDVREKLAVGGRFYAGFGPLYYSPFGDHRRLRTGLPWAHVIIPERILFRRLREKHGIAADSVFDLGLNKFRAADYERLISNSGLRIVLCRTNVSRNVISRAFSVAAHVRPLREYFTHNMYFVLERAD